VDGRTQQFLKRREYSRHHQTTTAGNQLCVTVCSWSLRSADGVQYFQDKYMHHSRTNGQTDLQVTARAVEMRVHQGSSRNTVFHFFFFPKLVFRFDSAKYSRNILAKRNKTIVKEICNIFQGRVAQDFRPFRESTRKQMSMLHV
jgi:hypothetical protein